MSAPLDILRPPYAPIRKTTTSAVAVEVFAHAVKSGGGCTARLTLQGVRRSTGVTNYFERVIRCSNASGTPVITSNNAPVPDDAPTGFSVTVAATLTGFTVSVVGAAYNVDWAVGLNSLLE